MFIQGIEQTQKRAKGVKRSIFKKEIQRDNFKEGLDNYKTMCANQNFIR